MAGVDSLLRMLAQYGADELRLGTDEAPRMSSRGSPVRLSIPPTNDMMLRHLVEGILTPEREAALGKEGRLETAYKSEGGDPFAVSFARVGSGFSVTFRKGAAGAAARATTPAAAAPAATTSQRPSPTATATPTGATTATATGTATATPTGTGTATPTGTPTATATPTSTSPPASALPPASASPSASAPPLRVVASPHALSALLEHAVALGASDVHLMSGERPTLRIDGQLQLASELPPVAVDELFAAQLQAGGAGALDGGRSADLGLELPSVGRFRANVYRVDGRLAAAVRVLMRAAPSLAELRFPVPLDDVVAAAHGLVIVCGPTGSGKSATLAALANEAVRRRGGVLISLEDPVEYAIAATPPALVRQRQIGRDVRDFPTGLRDALREDPDILLIGEMRDPETISLALTAAETGHLVLTSLHSRSTASSIERIVDSYPPERQGQIRVQLADALRVVVAQRLLPRARGGGRVPAVEILRGNHNVASLVREGKTQQLASVLQSSRKEGMVPLERTLADLVRGGQVTRESAVAVANDATQLASYLG